MLKDFVALITLSLSLFCYADNPGSSEALSYTTNYLDMPPLQPSQSIDDGAVLFSSESFDQNNHKEYQVTDSVLDQPSFKDKSYIRWRSEKEVMAEFGSNGVGKLNEYKRLLSEDR